MDPKKYLISRATSMLAWVGAIGFVLELLLHLGDISVLMLVFFSALIVVPEEWFHAKFKSWAEKLESM